LYKIVIKLKLKNKIKSLSNPKTHLVMQLKLDKNIAVSDSGMLFNPATGESFTVNPIGLRILDHMREGLDLQKIAAAITDEFNVEPEIAERDLMDFTNMLKHYQLSNVHVETQN
jgi:hypothetical protein